MHIVNFEELEIAFKTEINPSTFLLNKLYCCMFVYKSA